QGRGEAASVVEGQEGGAGGGAAHRGGAAAGRPAGGEGDGGRDGRAQGLQDRQADPADGAGRQPAGAAVPAGEGDRGARPLSARRGQTRGREAGRADRETGGGGAPRAGGGGARHRRDGAGGRRRLGRQLQRLLHGLPAGPLAGGHADGGRAGLRSLPDRLGQ